MLTQWIPWKFLIKRVARSHGLIDPLTFLARLRRFTQPSEVQEPIELLRAGIAFHARGLINTKAIQHNLDWVWPYWVEKQFNPDDTSFIPRAFSFSHVNLTHRNWTSVGHPDLPLYPIVDPRGLITPLYDGWSIDLWAISRNGEMLLPSKLQDAEQRLILSPNLAVETISIKCGMEIKSRVTLDIHDHKPFLDITVTGRCPEGGWIVAALRPYNPEGIQFIEKIRYQKDRPGLLVNSRIMVEFDRAPEKVVFSNYSQGDVVNHLEKPGGEKIVCKVGMATAAALFPVSGAGDGSVRIQIPLESDLPQKSPLHKRAALEPSIGSWNKALSSAATLQVPDEKIQFLYDAAVRTLILLSADEIVPGPYTYRRFWFRDACLMLNALMTLGMTERSFRILDTFPARQNKSGYFQSQEGEWDSNGQVLWIMDRFQKITGHAFSQAWMRTVIKGADWIARKRIREQEGTLHSGLFPPGFSAEHLGPNDYYYWDALWGVAGLRGASRLAGLFGSPDQQRKYELESLDFEQSIFNSIDRIPESASRGGIPASSYRRMDSGAIGSLVADYPLQITHPGDVRITNTAKFLIENCFHRGAFFQNIIHSGINIYLTLDLAETLLRSGGDRYQELIRTVADLASPTGQWPEAIHPITLGGCMGDGQHGWASAEWAMMIRNLFVREEGETLVLGSGILPEWIETGSPIAFGPTSTPFGSIAVRFFKKDGKAYFEIVSDLSNTPNPPKDIVIKVPGYQKTSVADLDQKISLLKEMNL
ncbi:MAG: hypothetical protein Q7I97_04605 [Thermovirgaceae bacterium]|nr:hypothetical protein [Thermovirgaceae bacterium]